MAFRNLTRRHGFKVLPAGPCSVEECVSAVAKLIGGRSIVSAARMNKAVVFFVDEVRKAEAVIASKVVIRDTLANVLPLGTPAKKVILSNLPPYVDDKVLEKQLSRFGKLVTTLKMIPSGYKDPELKHILSYRRFLYMILNNRDQDLNITFKVYENGEEFVVFATSGTLKCFGCGQEGHLIRNCPEKQATGNQAADMRKEKDKESVQDQSSEQTTGQEETKQPDSNTEGQEEVNTEQGTSHLETENENPQTNANENTEQNTQLTDHHSHVECSGSENADMIVDDASFTVVRSKRKSKAGGPQTRKRGLTEAGKGQVKNSQESETRFSSDEDMNADTESDEEQNDERNDGYQVKEIKRFLQKTKKMKGVRVDQHFPDKQNFVITATDIIKGKNENFTHQEIFRLKKFVTKTRQDLLCENEESI